MTKNKTLKEIGEDRRVKLTDEQRNDIINHYQYGSTYAHLARKYDVSPTLIRYICNPELLQEDRERYNERRKDGRYKLSKYKTNEQWNKQNKEYRRRRRELGLVGTQNVKETPLN